MGADDHSKDMSVGRKKDEVEHARVMLMPQAPRIKSSAVRAAAPPTWQATWAESSIIIHPKQIPLPTANARSFGQPAAWASNRRHHNSERSSLKPPQGASTERGNRLTKSVPEEASIDIICRSRHIAHHGEHSDGDPSKETALTRDRAQASSGYDTTTATTTPDKPNSTN